MIMRISMTMDNLDRERAYIMSFHSSIQEVNKLPFAVRRLLSMDSTLLNSGVTERQMWQGYIKWVAKWSLTIARFCRIEEYETARLAQDIIDSETKDLISAMKAAKIITTTDKKEETEELITDILTQCWVNAYESVYGERF